MEHQKILDLLNEGNNSKFVPRKWNIGNDNSNQIILQQMKLPIIHKFQDLIFVITARLTF